jgi:pantoate kinase
MINVIRDPKFDKLKNVALQSIKNIIKNPDHERYLRQLGANDVIVMANMQSNIGSQLGQSIVGSSIVGRK